MEPEEIRALRKQLGLNQAEFGALVGANHATVSGWERGAHRPTSFHHIKLLADLASGSGDRQARAPRRDSRVIDTFFSFTDGSLFTGSATIVYRPDGAWWVEFTDGRPLVAGHDRDGAGALLAALTA